MCVSWVMARAERRIITKKLSFGKDRYVTLWKVFDIKSNNKQIEKLQAQFNEYIFTIGKNTAEGKHITNTLGGWEDVQYTPGFHCFMYKSDAENWKDGCVYQHVERIVLPVKIRKGWITSMGKQNGFTVIVCKHIIIEKESIECKYQ